MHDPRISTAMSQLADLARTEPSPWAWAVAHVDPKGRVALPAEARLVLEVAQGRRTSVRGVCNRVALVVRAEGPGAAVAVDARGRLAVPVWLRRPPPAPVVVGTQQDTAVVVIAPTTVLEGLGDLLVGGPR